MGPWTIPDPGPKPPPGPARSAWLDVQMLHRHRHDIARLLDKIDPALRQDAHTTLDSGRVALHVLEFLETMFPETVRTTKLPALLAHLTNGFRNYCKHHGCKMLRLPLVREMGVDQGLLDGDVLVAARLHRECADARRSARPDQNCRPARLVGRSVRWTRGD
jgi:hypothetical protein